MSSPDISAATRLDRLSNRIAEALATSFDTESGFGETEFYGTAFACLLWGRAPERFGDSLQTGLDRLKAQNKSEPIGTWQNPFHWEFVRFALADLFRHGAAGGYENPEDVLGATGFVRNRVANWTLLRSTVRMMGSSRLDRRFGRLERWLALMAYQKPGGFIEDQRGAPTQQYHAFMAALLGYQILVLDDPSVFVRDRFVKALEALVATALFDGEVNPTGRGRFQSFGYAAAAYAIAAGLKLDVAPAGALCLLHRVLDRLERAIGADGVLPLMITRIDEFEQSERPPHHRHQRRIGWHSYNNGPDYLAFSGAVLKLGSEQLSAFEEPAEVSDLPPVDRLVDGLRVVRNSCYSAIVTLPHRALAAAQPLPYLVTASGARPLPSYGGEALPESIYSALAMPLPVIEQADGSLHDIVYGTVFRWSGPDRIVGETANLRFERRFQFETNRIRVEDTLTISEPREQEQLHFPWLTLPFGIEPKSVTENGAVFPLGGATLISEQPLFAVDGPHGEQFGMSGRLRAWSAPTPFPAVGDVANVRYEISF